MRQVYFTKWSCQRWGRVSRPYILFIHHIWGKQYYEALSFFFIIQTSERMQFFTVLQTNCTNSQYSGQYSMRFLYTTIYRIDHIIKRFHEENSIMSGLFSQNNLLLCGVQLRVITSGILSTPASNVHVRLKTTGTEIKIVRETTNNQKYI